ncbi:MAG: hypothetical protein A2W29_04085 [Gemmatimonadetes bacterium RBG_16_66_8]|nr:MAG: hypothetical protein A2W29_04085 [Gemmatimonadetes bacterium RBG_16_66_8]
MQPGELVVIGAPLAASLIAFGAMGVAFALAVGMGSAKAGLTAAPPNRNVHRPATYGLTQRSARSRRNTSPTWRISVP